MAYTYICEHLDSGEAYSRKSTLLNPYSVENAATSYVVIKAVEEFHKSLPEYGETRLHNLSWVAKELGFAHIFLKDESTRFGLPSFKVAGASWAVHRALCRRVGLEQDASLDDLRRALAGDDNVRLVTCTEGNWGRAVGRMSRLLGVPATIYVPFFMNTYTQDLIRGEGADVKVLDGDYDAAVATTVQDSKNTGAILVMDTGLDGYTEIPQWVTDGYSTILNETDRQVAEQTDGKRIDLATCSVGVGSWAQAVVGHYKSKDARCTVVSVEPDTAASFKESLHNGKVTAIRTGHSIMNGMNCGTSSLVAWPVLKTGINAATVVSDRESHDCVVELQAHGINAGPCGAANLAALRRVCQEIDLGDRADRVVVLFSTEGTREYDVPT